MQVRNKQDYNWLRVMVRTQYGAPARGATVQITTNTGDRQMRVIDGGSGYLCQMEPIAHFGLKDEIAESVTVTWPDTRSVSYRLTQAHNKQQIDIRHPDAPPKGEAAYFDVSRQEVARNSQGANITHEEL